MYVNKKTKFIILLIIFFGVFGLSKSSWVVYSIAFRRKFSLNLLLFFSIAVFSSFCFAAPALGADYYVDSLSGVDTNLGTIEKPWKTIHKANATLIAGDTVYIRGGASDFQVYYTGATDSLAEGIHPKNSGADSNHRITYAVYPGEKVHFVGNYNGSRGINLSGVNWIKITGYDGSSSAMNMKFTNMFSFLWIHDGITSPPYGKGSDYNEISYIEFAQTNSNVINIGDFRTSTIYHNSHYNWIHHCSFHEMGGYTNSDNGLCLEIGYDDCGITTSGICSDTTANNVIENNEFYHCGHHAIGLLQYNNIVRNNIFHNEQWYQGADDNWYGYRVFQMASTYNTDYHSGYNLVEGNRISHATNNYNTSLGGAGFHVGNSNDIFRYNDIYANAGNSFYLENHSESTTGRINFNHIYNNTFMSNGYGATFPDATNPVPRSSPPDRTTLYFVSGNGSVGMNIFANSMYGNVVKNNLFWKNYTGSIIANSGMWNYGWDFNDCTGYDVCGDTIFSNNWVDDDGNPKFASEGGYSSPHVQTTDVEWYWPFIPNGSNITAVNKEPNLMLQSDSPVINQGAQLTQANGSGSNSNNLVVDDAKYFQPGWGNGAGGGASVAADRIAIGSINNVAQINSINYDTDTLTLSSSLNWSDNDPVWLYEKSDNVQVLYGSAPDCGAHEYTNAGDTTSPASPVNLTAQ